MAVHKSLRGDSTVQFVDTARVLAVLTRKYAMRLPKRYTFLGGQELVALADATYNEVKKANSIYPTSQKELWLRRVHLIEANGNLQALVGQMEIMVELLRENNSQTLQLKHATEEWAKAAIEEAKLIAAIKKADKERFKNLK